MIKHNVLHKVLTFVPADCPIIRRRSLSHQQELVKVLDALKGGNIAVAVHGDRQLELVNALTELNIVIPKTVQQIMIIKLAIVTSETTLRRNFNYRKAKIARIYCPQLAQTKETTIVRCPCANVTNFRDVLVIRHLKWAQQHLQVSQQEHSNVHQQTVMQIPMNIVIAFAGTFSLTPKFEKILKEKILFNKNQLFLLKNNNLWQQKIWHGTSLV